MTHTTATADPAASVGIGAKYLNFQATKLLNVLVIVWMFSGSFVLQEPSPYELMFVMVLPMGVLARVGLIWRCNTRWGWGRLSFDTFV